MEEEARVNFRPIGKRVLIEPFAAEEVTPGGIIIPDESQDKVVDGIVVAIANSVEEIPIGVHAIYGKYTGTEIGIDGVKYICVLEQDVLGVFE